MQSAGKETYRAKTSKGEATRQKLLDVAEEIFGAKGYFHTSVVDITQRAGVAQGTFYVYFPGKQHIFRELVEELSHNLRREIQIAVNGAAGRKEKEIRGFAAFFDYVRKHRNLYRIVQEAEFVDPALYKWYYRRLAEGYVKGLQEAMDRGEFRRLDPEAVAYCLMGMGEFLGMRWVLWEKKDVPEEAFRAAMELIMGGLEKRD
ncbi:TetR/AcrR family transcriptional regulator [Desulfotomaculum copahuensis]|uniref:TetR/AcrR family transcriptional regulator n=1 Tax=Desulfotomaculum copahuensis TaxID=1838280 RepID=UPI001246EA5E|nr:TetR/AcrR family transcriptional regulator [Desulfotomaculum copahuensis]